jgi:hypothetical protein
MTFTEASHVLSSPPFPRGFFAFPEDLRSFPKFFILQVMGFQDRHLTRIDVQHRVWREYRQFDVIFQVAQWAIIERNFHV